jgi:hypothetical protein
VLFHCIQVILFGYESGTYIGAGLWCGFSFVLVSMLQNFLRP